MPCLRRAWRTKEPSAVRVRHFKLEHQHSFVPNNAMLKADDLLVSQFFKLALRVLSIEQVDEFAPSQCYPLSFDKRSSTFPSNLDKQHCKTQLSERNVP